LLSKIINFVIGREPVAVGAVVTALVGLAVAFGADLSEEQTAAISAVAVAVVGWLARSVVTPVRKVTR
jgi:uncharacterized protein (DUF697 family)